MTAGLTIELPRPSLLPPAVAPAEFRIWSRVDGDLIRIVVSGELDVATDEVLREALAAAMPSRVDLDLSGVLFMGCSTLKVLLGAAARHAERGEVLSISAASDAVARVVDIAGLNHLLHC